MNGFVKYFSIWGIRPRYLKTTIMFNSNLKIAIEYLSELGISDVSLKKYYDSIESCRDLIITEYSYDDTFLDIEDVANETDRLGLQLKRLNKDFVKLIKMVIYNNKLHLPARELVDKFKELYEFEEVCLAGTWKWQDISNLIINPSQNTNQNIRPLLKSKSTSFKISRNRSNSSRFSIFASNNAPRSPSPLNTPRNHVPRSSSLLSDNE